MDIMLSADFKTSIEFFESGLNALQNGLHRTAIKDMMEARKQAIKALAIYKMNENQVKAHSDSFPFFSFFFNISDNTNAEYILFNRLQLSKTF